MLSLLIAATLALQGTGSTTGILLELPPSARALGLGGAYAAVVGDESSVFANPAGMATIRRIAVGGSWERSLLGTTLTTGAVAVRAGRFDFGAGFALLDYGGDPLVTTDPLDPDRGIEQPELIRAYQALGVGAVAYRRGFISVGASVKALREHVGADTVAYTASGMTGDLGFALAVFDLMALGVVVQNVAGRMRAGPEPLALPRTTRVGLTLNFIDPLGTARLMTTTDYVAPPGGNAYWAIGFEAGAVASGLGIVGRLGFALGRAPSDRGGLAYGGSVQLRSLRLDYGYQPYDAMGGASERFGIRWIP